MGGLLAVSELYVAIDGVLGGRHVTSLIPRYLVLATVLLVGLRITRGLAAAGGYGLIAGTSLAPSDWSGGLRFVNYAAVLGYVAGLAVLWFSGLISNPSGNAKATLRRNRDSAFTKSLDRERIMNV